MTRQCQGITQKGYRCRNMVACGSLCHLHEERYKYVYVPNPSQQMKVKALEALIKAEEEKLYYEQEKAKYQVQNMIRQSFGNYHPNPTETIFISPQQPKFPVFTIENSSMDVD